MEEITKRRESLLYVVDKVAEYSLEIKEWMSRDPTQEYRQNHSMNLNKMLIMFEGLDEQDKLIAPFDSTNYNALMTWILAANIEDWREVTNERNRIDWQTKFEAIEKSRDIKMQHEFVDDSKRTVRKISVSQSPMCKNPAKKWRHSGRKDGNKIQSLIQIMLMIDFNQKIFRWRM
jgi:hypothetical protein